VGERLVLVDDVAVVIRFVVDLRLFDQHGADLGVGDDLASVDAVDDPAVGIRVGPRAVRVA